MSITKYQHEDLPSFRVDEQAPLRLPIRVPRKARGPDREGRRDRAARAAREQGSVPMWLRPAVSSTAAAMRADFDGYGRSDYYRER